MPTSPGAGVDDFALRKRHTYGTILVDLEHRQPVAFLPDRTAETVAQWLQEHPGVEVIARDRSRAYAEGARQGASAAIEVADRFHVLQNLREALEQVFTTSPQAFEAVNALERQQPVVLPDGVVAVPVPPPAEPPHARAAACGAAPGPPAGAAYADLDFASARMDRRGHCPARGAESPDGAARSPDRYVRDASAAGFFGESEKFRALDSLRIVE